MPPPLHFVNSSFTSVNHLSAILLCISNSSQDIFPAAGAGGAGAGSADGEGSADDCGWGNAGGDAGGRSTSGANAGIVCNFC